jgi:hypothetical protein
VNEPPESARFGPISSEYTLGAPPVLVWIFVHVFNAPTQRKYGVGPKFYSAENRPADPTKKARRIAPKGLVMVSLEAG